MNGRTNLRGLVAAVCSLPLLAFAQTYPTKPVKIVVGYAAGGAVDIVARTVGQSMAGSLGQLSPTRSTIFPDVPTIAQFGFPGFEASVWYGFVAPTATPKPIVAQLHAEVQKALQTKEVRERMAGVGGEVICASAEQFGALIRSERLRYEKLVREANIKPD